VLIGPRISQHRAVLAEAELSRKDGWQHRGVAFIDYLPDDSALFLALPHAGAQIIEHKQAAVRQRPDRTPLVFLVARSHPRIANQVSYRHKSNIQHCAVLQ